MKVTFREKTIILPTYHLGLNPHPFFYATHGQHVYPYPFSNTENRKFIPKRKYRALVLENRYIRLTFLPEVGGRIYSAYDKTAGREMFYFNRVIKEVNMGIGGGYVGCGMELNYPDAHSITNIRPRNCRVKKHRDGSVSVIVHEIERIYRTKWSVTFTLSPESSFIEESIYIYNRTALPARFRYWSNASVKATPGLEFIFPEKAADQHGGVTYFTWPEFNRTDLSWYRNINEILGLYMLNPKEGFFGYYDHDCDAGVVHVADPHQVPGKKLWTWGHTDFARAREKHLTDADGIYAEIQSGRLVNQDHFEFLEPFQTLSWKEYWYPLHGIDTFKYANEHGAVNLEFFPCGNKRRESMRIGVSVTVPIPSACIRVTYGNENIFQSVGALTPEKPFCKQSEKIPPFKKAPVTLTVQTQDGRILISYTTKPRSGSSDEKAKMPVEISDEGQTAESIYLKGKWEERMGRYDKAQELYLSALAQDKEFSQARKSLGVMYYRSARFEEAEKELEISVARNHFDGTSHYYLGLVQKALGKYEQAKESLWEAIRLGCSDKGYYFLGELALREKNYRAAKDMLEHSRHYNPQNIKALVLEAFALRKMGNPKAAEVLLQKAIKIDPTDYFAHSELIFLQADAGRKREESILQETLFCEMADNFTQTLLEITTDYLSVCALEEGLTLLKGFRHDKKRVSEPMVHYYLSYLYRLLGNFSSAKREETKARTLPHRYVFPWRIEEIDILQSAVTTCPQDSIAPYYLGDLLFARGRIADGITAWEKSLQAGGSSTELHRNLALAYWKVQNDLQKAEKHYRMAIAGDPSDPYPILELSSLYSTQGNKKAQMKLFDAYHGTVSSNISLLSSYITLCIEEEFYDKGIRLLKHCSNFGDWFNIFYDQCERLYNERGENALSEGHPCEALTDFHNALNKPKNLGLPFYKSQARTLYNLGLAHEALGNIKEAVKIWEKAVTEKHTSLWNRYSEYEIWRVRYYQGLCLKKLGRAEEANTYLDGMIEFAKRATQGKAARGAGSFASIYRDLMQKARVDDHRALYATLEGEESEA